MKGKADNTIELLLVAGSSLDRKGRRVLVRENEVENVIWPSDGVSEADVMLLGISDTDQKHIEKWFSQQ